MGRHREFDQDEALDQALTIFWQKGYEGTSFSDIEEKTNVARPGLYAAFGNKESLFLRALDLYEQKFGGYFAEALAKPTSREVAATILRGSIPVTTQGSGRLGCMGLNAALACSEGAEPIRSEIIRRWVVAESDLKRRFDRAKAEGDLRETADTSSLATLVMSVMQGLAVKAKSGSSRRLLEKAADDFLALWPA
jgi:AcrR family transcriptional regulator